MTNGKYIIAGGSKGVGLEIVKKLAAAGNEVIVLSRNRFNAEIDGNISHHQYDFMSENPFPEIHGPVDGLVYCPGSIILKPVSTLKQDEILDAFKLNALGAFNFIKNYKGNLQQGNNPGIVLFSSVAAGKGMPFHTGVAMSKGAVEGLTLALAAELSPKIRVNCIAPSLTDTSLAEPLLNSETKRIANAERHPLKRIGVAEEVAELAVFLLKESKWMTGQVIGLNGGLGTIIK